MAQKTGLLTGLLGYNLKKEFLGNGLYFRETQTFEYEIYSLDLSGLSPNTIHSTIYQDFRNRFSGDINVKVFEAPASYAWPNDSIRAAKYRVSVEAKSPPASGSQPELTGAYYSGLSQDFFNKYSVGVIDFKENFSFEQGENGNQSFGHDVVFSLLSGTKTTATQLAKHLFDADKDTTFGITAMVGGVTIANTGNFLDYFTEVYDEIRQSYHFTKRREILAGSGSNYFYNFNHSMDIKDDGVFDINERCNIKGRQTFTQAQQAVDSLLGSAYGRCNTFYSTYKDATANYTSTYPLVNFPTRTVKTFIPQSIEASYDVSYTTDPRQATNGSATDEVFEMNVNELKVVDISHRMDFTLQKRTATTDFAALLANATGYSPTAVSTYFGNTNFQTANWPLNLIKYNYNWPNRKNKANISFQYSNNPRFFRTINGVSFQFVETKVQHVKPVDIVNEYKIINRPSKSSIINYAYQTEKGQINVTVDAGLGRNANEFLNGFRSNHAASLVAVYRHGISTFMTQFHNVVPLAFTYFLSDIKYSINHDGILSMTLTFTYTLKKYTR
jgi:hypothetical protein